MNGVTLVQEFREEGVTGEADWSNRPAFTEMLTAIMGNGVRVVVVENLTRLARSFVVQDTILTYLASKGVELYAADSGENITEALRGDPVKRAIIQIQGVFSELEKATIVRKLKAARERKKKETGRCDGRKPFGSRPGEQEVIDRMKELRKTGMSFPKIAAKLDEEGRKPHQGGKWQPETVRLTLKRKTSS